MDLSRANSLVNSIMVLAILAEIGLTAYILNCTQDGSTGPDSVVNAALGLALLIFGLRLFWLTVTVFQGVDGSTNKYIAALNAVVFLAVFALQIGTWVVRGFDLIQGTVITDLVLILILLLNVGQRNK